VIFRRKPTVSEYLTEITSLLIEGNFRQISEVTKAALDSGISAADILNHGLMPGMDHVGVEFKAGRVFVPEVLKSAKAMQESMDIIRPILAETGAKPSGKIVLGTVKGDLHDIGKNLVAMMCEGAGFDVTNLGKDIDPQTFVDAVNDLEPDIIGMSALLTTTMISMDRTIKALVDAGVRDQVIVLVGGAPVNYDFAEEIGADGYAANAAEAVDLAKRLIAEK
jgi:5-methyltetrahydrofolate--homocysteine methyltransferase